MKPDKIRKSLMLKYHAAGTLRKLVVQEGYRHLTIGDLSHFLRGVKEPVGHKKRIELGLDVRIEKHIPYHKLPFKMRCELAGEPGIYEMFKSLQQKLKK